MNTISHHINPPKAKKILKKLETHQHQRDDHYYWLNQRENKEVLQYLKAENKYTESVISNFKELTDEVYEELKSRIKPDEKSAYYKIGPYYYFTYYKKGKEYPIYCRKKNLDSENFETLLDINELARDLDFCDVSSFKPSPDHQKIAFSLDDTGRRIYDIHVIKLDNYNEKVVRETTGNFAWGNDSNSIVFTTQDKTTLRSNKAYYRNLDTKENQLLFSEEDEIYSLYVEKSRSKEYIFFISHAKLSTEYHYLKADLKDFKPQLFSPREKELEYEIDHGDDCFYIRTNENHENFEIKKTDLNKTFKENWQDFIPASNARYIESIEAFKDYLLLEERKDGLTNIRYIHAKSLKSSDIEFNETTYSTGLDSNHEFDTHTIRFYYESLTTPQKVIDFNLSNKTQTIVKTQKVLGNFNSDNYQSKRVFAKSQDGIEIPISMVYHKDYSPSEKTPLLLYGYGSYGISSDPDFNPHILSLLDRGFTFAIAHIRGGAEMGKRWYLDGKFFKKKNTFTDFIDCTKFLINEKLANPKKVYAYGGSAGGLLMGAVMNMAGELYHGVIATVPFVDVTTTMLDTSIPLTTGEFDEWGNPAIKKYYDYILSYSPYDNVVAKDYPHLLILTGFHDSQVQYWEPAKWTAKLRELKTDNNLLLLKTNMKEGHSGTTGRYQRLKDTALRFSFLIYLSNYE
jgi:oligopeptidase B